MNQYRVAAAVAVFVDADNRPVVYPFHRLQVPDGHMRRHPEKCRNQSSPVGGVYPCSLMRAVDRAVTLCQYLLPFVRAVYVLGAEDNLPAGGHAACRMEDVVIFSSFIEFGTFAGLMRFMTVEDDARLFMAFVASAFNSQMDMMLFNPARLPA